MSTLIYYAIPLFFVTMLAEYLYSRHRGLDLYEGRDTAASLSMGVGNVLIAFVWKSVQFAFYVVLYEFRLFDIDMSLWWAWVLLIPLEDLCYYWFHRLHHEVRVFWAAHVNHHSSERYNLATALRQSWTTPFTAVPFWMLLPLLGFHPLAILTAQGISLLYQYWIHTETLRTLGPLEWILNTPSHHRVHHGRNIRYLDRNYAGIFILWDRIFGTFEREGERVEYGILHPVGSYNPVRIAFHEWQAMLRDLKGARSLREVLGYTFGPPGWSPDGSRKTAKDLQADLHQTRSEHAAAPPRQASHRP